MKMKKFGMILLLVLVLAVVTAAVLPASGSGMSPATGDDFEAWPFIVLMVLSAAGVIVLIVGRKQWFKKNK